MFPTSTLSLLDYSLHINEADLHKSLLTESLNKKNLHLSPPTITSNRFTPLANEGSETTPTPTGPTNVPKPPQSTSKSHVITALANNQVRVQPTTADSYKSISHILTAKSAEFHTFKPKEERNYRVVLKRMHYSVNPDNIKSEIEKLGRKHMEYQTISDQPTTLHVFRRPQACS
jgi:hypothetical protein